MWIRIEAQAKYEAERLEKKRIKHETVLRQLYAEQMEQRII